MLSDISLARLDGVHPELARRIKQLDALLPSQSLQVTQGTRTYQEQHAIFIQGRPNGTPGPIVTDADAGESAHNFGYAVDVVPEDVIPGQPDWNIESQAWKSILAAAPSCGLAEGACWKKSDNPHLYLAELPADPTDAMREQIADGGMAEVWKNFPVPLNAL